MSCAYDLLIGMQKNTQAINTYVKNERFFFVQLTKADYAKYHYLIGMEGINIRYMNKITGGDQDGKFYKMMEFAGDGWKDLMTGNRNMDRAGDVADPWYTRDFGATWRDVSAGCEGLLEYLLAMERDKL